MTAITPERLGAVSSAFLLIAKQAAVVKIEEIEAAIDAGKRSEVVIPLTDPSRWRDHGDAIQLATKGLEAFLRFRRELEALRPKEPA